MNIYNYQQDMRVSVVDEIEQRALYVDSFNNYVKAILDVGMLRTAMALQDVVEA